jgi:murein DD-endopeptidase MepM/ murein hydrolase activator NlpD
MMHRPSERGLSPRHAAVRVVHWLRIGVEAVVAIGVAAALAFTPSLSGAPSAAVAALPSTPASPNLAAAYAAAAAETRMLAAVLGPTLAGRERVDAQVRRGDTLADVLEDEGVAPAEFNAALASLRGVFDPRTLQAGQHVELFVDREDDEDAQLIGLALSPDVAQRIEVTRLADGDFRARAIETPLTRRIARAQGEITESLYSDAIAAGASDAVVSEIASVFAYSVDFQREIHPGDAFDIVFDQYLDPAGHVVKTGDIHYVAFSPSGRDLAYWRYTPPETAEELEEAGYYDALGESARRFLMKTPVNATRISSGFSRARRHPVLGYTRAHKGTDFAAPRGTPIYAAGNGVVERANEYGSFGNYVRIRHANGYQTIYGHLNGFARGVRAGVHVTQGQVIGYVGMTGTATGPHLHYEVHLDGEAVDPMSLNLPTGRKLAEDELPAYEVERAIIAAMAARAVPATTPADGLLVEGETTDHAALEAAAPEDG